MQQTIHAYFENLDTAEAAAFAVKKQVQHTEILSVKPRHPESTRLTQGTHERFTILPTAIAFPNYITALVKTEYNFEDMRETDKRQTSDVLILCDADSIPAAENILIAHGGTMLPS